MRCKSDSGKDGQCALALAVRLCVECCAATSSRHLHALTVLAAKLPHLERERDGIGHCTRVQNLKSSLRLPATPSLQAQPVCRQKPEYDLSWRCQAISVSEKVSAALEGDSLDEWNLCVARIQEIGFEADKARNIVGQAFGWGKQSYWLNKKTDQTPNLKQINEVIAFLEEDLRIKDADLTKIVESFPEVINCSVENRLKANIGHMKKAYYMNDAAAVKAVRRKPEVLGYTYDCEGSCEGLCSQCWVRL